MSFLLNGVWVTRPFIVSFIPGDQYGGPDCFISCLHVLFTEINQIKIKDAESISGINNVLSIGDLTNLIDLQIPYIKVKNSRCHSENTTFS